MSEEEMDEFYKKDQKSDEISNKKLMQKTYE